MKPSVHGCGAENADTLNSFSKLDGRIVTETAGDWLRLCLLFLTTNVGIRTQTPIRNRVPATMPLIAPAGKECSGAAAVGTDC